MMDKIIPWNEWVSLIKPYYPSGKRGRPVRGIETMLRMYFLQVWFSLSDEMTEDSIYDSHAMRKFMHVNFGDEQAPDATTLLRFRHLLEEKSLCEKLFNDLNERLEANGCVMHGGTIVDATIIKAPSSTKNASGERDPEMHQTKKGNEWHFGMKAHIACLWYQAFKNGVSSINKATAQQRFFIHQPKRSSSLNLATQYHPYLRFRHIIIA